MLASFVLYLILWGWENRSFEHIDRANRNKSEAERAYRAADYTLAASLYRDITSGSLFLGPHSRLYLAHSYFQLDSVALARQQYTLLRRVEDPTVASVANTQLALLACRETDTTAAIDFLELALRQNPANDTARYNYELLKTVFSGKVPPARKPQIQPEPRPATPEQQAVALAEKRQELLKSLRRLNMSEEQARSILDAMKTNETQYIYQLRRRQYHDQDEGSTAVEW